MRAALLRILEAVIIAVIIDTFRRLFNRLEADDEDE